MDLQHLKWTKNVKRADGDWAYREFKIDHLFKLAWRDSVANASRPQKNDLILLRQKGYVTHLVKVLDDKPDRETSDDYGIYRIVETLWTVDFDNPSPIVKSDKVFGYSVKYQGGDVMKLETLPTFDERWYTNGGLQAFQEQVRDALKLT
ncbi:hypothetical protein JYQ62_30835 [Nostoc sp. UHCC 0702]|nr:hypothetical protein JYQ62_30835 [Nostoc sp. UHCC 0702]